MKTYVDVGRASVISVARVTFGNLFAKVTIFSMVAVVIKVTIDLLRTAVTLVLLFYGKHMERKSLILIQ